MTEIKYKNSLPQFQGRITALMLPSAVFLVKISSSHNFALFPQNCFTNLGSLSFFFLLRNIQLANTGKIIWNKKSVLFIWQAWEIAIFNNIMTWKINVHASCTKGRGRWKNVINGRWRSLMLNTWMKGDRGKTEHNEYGSGNLLLMQ